MQLIWPPRNCPGFKTESHVTRLRVSKALIVTGCKIYMSGHASAQTYPSGGHWDTGNSQTNAGLGSMNTTETYYAH